MKKCIFILMASFFSAWTNAAIQLEIQPDKVSIGEPFKLIINQEGAQARGLPDLTVLQADFVILGTERSENYSIINGQAQTSSQWIISLQAKKSGIIVIPPIKMGGEQSSPLSINVQSASQEQNSPDRQDIELVSGVDVQQPYVNQQIIYTVKLYNSKRLLDADYQGPQVEDALLIPFGDSKRYQTFVNNTNYVVEEQTYAIFPQKSGSFKINSAVFTALVYDMNPQRVKAQDKPITLSVKPIPKQYTGETWVPAKQIRLSEQYENPNQKINQGSTLTRTVKIEGVALPAQLLPTIKFADTDAFKVYPEKGKEHNLVKQGELVGSNEIKVTYLFNQSGKVTIPELKLTWFNTVTGKEEQSALPPRSFDITPVAASASSPNQNTVKTTIPSLKGQEPLPAPTNNMWPWVVALVFALAWLITLGGWLLQKRSRLQGKGKYKSTLVELGEACSAGDPEKARDALLKWASIHWPDAPLLNLTDLTKLVRDAHLKKQILILSKTLYGSREKALWRGDELLRSVHSVKRTNSAAKRTNNSLPPINPL